MFTQIRKTADGSAGRRGPGRPRGTTARGEASRERLYQVAVRLIAARGYAATTLRDIAREAGVSPALLYRYFPSKRAVVLALYDRLSLEHAERARAMPAGSWRVRFRFALEASLRVLGPRRETLAALAPVLVGDAEEGLFAPATAFSRRRVQAVFEAAVEGARDAPGPEDAAALGRLLYLVHLAVLLWWLLDRSPRQRATRRWLELLDRVLPLAALSLQLAPARAVVREVDGLVREGLLGEAG